ncbi:phosphatidylserine decarboxylase [Colletotrichum simmondsii]|uniref:Phosphatidylserine decarboxylase n=1 Tax=Colletotrichum simmondsii TaxID=703756 RepID=A0A135RSD4_9PEZI|nr:phosphatidylserine decarboxylase [Colletotrichum simmondsii]
MPSAPFPDRGTAPLEPIISMLATYLDLISPSSSDTDQGINGNNNALSQAVAAAYTRIPTFMSRFSITDAPSFLRFANDLLTWVPSEGCEGRDIYDVLLAGDEVELDGGGGGGIVEVEKGGVVRIKGLPWTIGELLGGCGGGEEFEGGIWIHAFLNTYNYHHVHAPVSGRVVEARKVRGLACFEVVVDDEEKRAACRRVEDVSKWKDERGLTAPNSPGYQFLQTRGVVVIENPLLGKVAVLPVGMAMVSSVRLSVEVGDVVEKGDEIAGFAFGGSDVVCAFERRAGLRVEDFVRSPREEGEWSKYGSVLARVS